MLYGKKQLSIKVVEHMMIKKMISLLLVSGVTLVTLFSPLASAQEVTRLFNATNVQLSDVENGLNQPYGIEAVGNTIYIADTYNNMIKKLINGQVEIIAGSYEGVNSLGFPLGGLQDGEALTAKFNKPRDVLVTEEGTIYVADSQNHVIRKIKDGMVKTFSGNGTAGDSVGTAQMSAYNLPTALAMDQLGNLYVADTLNDKIKVITPSGISRELSYEADASVASLNEPSDLCFDSSGALYILDSGNQCVKKIVDGKMTVVAGRTALSLDEQGYAPQGYVDGMASLAKFNFPKGIACDDRGNLFIADTWNNVVRVLTVDGQVHTYTGDLYAGNTVGSLVASRYDAPTSLDITSGGSLYLSDRWNNEIKKIEINMSTEAMKLSSNYLKQFVDETLLSDALQIWMDGETVTTEVPAFIENEDVYLPLKSTLIALGYDVKWDEAAFAVVVVKDDFKKILDASVDVRLLDGKSYVTPYELDKLVHKTVQYEESLNAIIILN